MRSLHRLSIDPCLRYDHLWKTLTEEVVKLRTNDPRFLTKKEIFIILYVEGDGYTYSDGIALTALIDSLIAKSSLE